MKHTVEEIRLRNGAKGLLIHVPNTNVMNFDLEFRAGHYLVDRKKWETPHLMEHMVFGANQQYPSVREFSAEFEKNGAYNNASTDVYSLHYLAECADFEWQRIMELLLISVSKPLFVENEFKSEYGNVREEMISRSNDNFRFLYQKLAIGSGYISLTDKERVKLMSNVGLDDLKNHFKKTHTTNNLRFIITGNMHGRRKKIKQMLESLPLPKGERFELPKQKIHGLKDVMYIRRPSVKNIYYSLDMFIDEPVSRHEESVLSLLNVLLGERENSLIYGQARERGLSYYVEIAHAAGLDNLNWGISGQVSVENSEELFRLMKTQLDSLRSGNLSQSDLRSAKHYFIGALQISLQTMNRLTSLYGRRYFLDEEIRSLNDIPEEIDAITKEDVVDMIGKLFEKKMWGMGALGNCGIAYARNLRDIVEPLWEN